MTAQKADCVLPVLMISLAYKKEQKFRFIQKLPEQKT